MSRQVQGYLYLALAMITVGSTVTASKLIAAGLPPFTATALRFAVAFPIFLILMRLTGAGWPRLTRRDWTILALQAGAGSVGYTTLLISGLKLTSSADASVVAGTLPVVSAGFAILVLGERPDRRIILAIALAALGVLTITARADGNTHSLIGNALIFAALICESVFILLNKRLHAEIPPLAQSTLMTGLGLGLALIPACLEQPWTAQTTSASFLAVLYYALIPTVCGFLLWFAGAARVSGAEAALFTALAPVTAMLLAVLFLDEPVGWAQVFGMGCVLMAIALAAASSRPIMPSIMERQ